MRRALVSATAALFASLLLATGAAGAPKGGQFGDTCVGAESGAPFGSVFEISRQGSPLPAAAPVSGVVTKWIAYMPTQLPEGLPRQSIRLVRLTGAGKVLVTAKSSLVSLRGGKNEFPTRLSVESGERLAFGSNEGGSIVCLNLPAESVEANSGGIGFPVPQPGNVAAYEATGYAVPVSAVIEPDADGDGFGDLTQDRCPESRDFHGACPVLHFAPRYKVGARTISVKVRSSVRARVAVSGLLPQLGASTGLRKTIPGGKWTAFNLSITPVMHQMLNRLSPRKTLEVPFVARVNHVPGNVSTDHLTVRIPGRR